MTTYKIEEIIIVTLCGNMGFLGRFLYPWERASNIFCIFSIITKLLENKIPLNQLRRY